MIYLTARITLTIHLQRLVSLGNLSVITVGVMQCMTDGIVMVHSEVIKLSIRVMHFIDFTTVVNPAGYQFV